MTIALALQAGSALRWYQESDVGPVPPGQARGESPSIKTLFSLLDVLETREWD